jgi:hypothetical protein
MQFLINPTNFNCSKKIPYHMANYLLERKSSREMRRSYYQALCESCMRKENPIKVTSGESRFVTSYKIKCGVLIFFRIKLMGPYSVYSSSMRVILTEFPFGRSYKPDHFKGAFLHSNEPFKLTFIHVTYKNSVYTSQKTRRYQLYR